MPYTVPHWIAEGATACKVDCVETVSFATQYAPMLEEMGRLTLLDTAAFTRMAIAWGKMMEAAQTLSYEGITIQATERGKDVEKRHPAALVYQNNEQILRQGFAEFGMTPSARRALRPGAGADADTPDTPEHSRGLLD